MSDIVYDGRAELDIDPFIRSLEKMETRATEVATAVEGALQKIENTLQALAGSSSQSAQAIVTNLGQARGAFTGLGQAANQGATAVTQAAKAQQSGVKVSLNEMVADAKAWKANLAAQNAEAARDFEKTAAAYQAKAASLTSISDPKALGTIRAGSSLDAENTAAEARAAADAVIAAKRDVAKAEADVVAAVQLADAQLIASAKKVAAEKRQLADQAILESTKAQAVARQAAQFDAAVAARESAVVKETAKAKADLAAKDAAAQKTAAAAQAEASRAAIAASKEEAAVRELNEKNALQDRKRFLDAQFEAAKENIDREISLLKNGSLEEMEIVRQRSAATIRMYEEVAAKAQQIQRAQSEKAVVSKIRMDQAGGSGNDRAYLDAQKAYGAAVAAAKAAEQEEISAQRNITEFKKAQRRAESLMAQETSHIEQMAANAAADRGKGFFAAISTEMRRAGDEIKMVENRYNSLFRAGSQISSIGKQMTFFSAMVGGTGIALKNSAEDFDFWARRAEASMLSAGSVWADGSKTMNQAIQDASFDLGAAVGTDDFAGIAEALYVYQSAAGTTVNSVEDLTKVQAGLQTVFQSSTITGDNYANTTRGILQVMAEFQMGTEDMSRAMTILMNSTQTTQAELPDMFEAFKYVGPLAHQLGMDVEDVAAVFGKLADYGLKGSQAGRGFAMMFEGLVAPTDKTSKALQTLLVDNRGLEGSWKDILAPGGQFLNLLNETAADGTVTEGVLQKLAMALKDYKPTEQMEFLNAIFGQNNAFRNAVPMIFEQINALNGVSTAADRGKLTLEQMADGFRDGAQQAKLFSGQWKTIEGSIRVQFGQAMGEVKKGLITMGTAVAEVMLPVVKSLGGIITKVMEWASANEGAAKTILKIIGGAGLLTAVLGPILVAFGAVVSSFGAFPVVAAAVTSGFGAIIRLATGLLPMLLGLSAPMLALVAAVTFLGFAWANNWLGMRTVLEEFMRGAGGDIVSFFEGMFNVLKAIFSGDGQALTDALRQMLDSIVSLMTNVGQVLWEAGSRAFGALVSGAVDAVGNFVSDLFNSIGQQISDAVGSLMNNMGTWGWNLVVTFGQGMLDAVFGIIPGVLNSLGNMIAGYTESHSPPKKGPLVGIFQWGKNLIKTFAEGMQAADIKDVEAAVDRIAGAMKDSFEAGTSTGSYLDGAKLMNEKVLEMFSIIKGGGNIDDTFFDSLAPYLGRWYEDIEKIMLAYQQVFALESGIRQEQERLDVLKAQRDELQKQLDLRTSAFDMAVDPTGPAYYKQYEADMVDPTTAEGKARIEQMRQSLSKEDFQSWISFQRKLWESRHKEEDGVLKVQEDTIALSIAAQEKQLALIKDQYETYVAMYEYAMKLANIEKDDPTKSASGGGGGGAAGGMDDDADTADLEAARKKV
jgi:TP901 family phage tail tape measure protein